MIMQTMLNKASMHVGMMHDGMHRPRTLCHALKMLCGCMEGGMSLVASVLTALHAVHTQAGSRLQGCKRSCCWASQQLPCSWF